MGDKLVIKLGSRHLGLETGDVERITEAARLHFIPGGKGLVNGMISLRGEPVVVIDTAAAFGARTGSAGAGGENHPRPRKIIVVRDKRAALGLDIGDSEVYFLWDEEIRDKAVLKETSRFILGRIETGKAPVELMDWGAVFNEAKMILSVKV